MAEPFAVTADDQGVNLTPEDSSATDVSQQIPTPEQVGILPDITQALGPKPIVPMPPPPAPAPSPIHDPRQQLLALATLGMALGGGLRNGGAGAFQGFDQASRQIHDDQMRRWQLETQENDKQRTAAVAIQHQAESVYNQREQNLQKALVNFKTSAAKVTTKAEYDSLAQAYGTSLQQAGYRTITPNWLRANIPYLQPSQQALASKAWTAWKANPNNKRLLDESPEKAFQSFVEVDLNGDGVKERVTVPQLAEFAGEGFAHTDQGLLAVPKPVANSTPFDAAYQPALAEFVATNRRSPTKKENDVLVSDAVTASQKAAPDQKDHFTFLPKYDEKGNPIGTMRGNTATGEITDASAANIKPPPAGKKPLPAQTADNLAGMNTAEVEGVKVLRDLKSAGLDQSNNPVDPRWQKFMATRLKMSSGDWRKADIQQRTAFVTAVLTRGLMGGRPSPYVAQMIQQHLPQGDMTGKKLYDVMTNVLEQAGERRTEIESLTEREAGSLAPSSGETYAQYLKSQSSATPYLSTDPNAGQPVRGRGGR